MSLFSFSTSSPADRCDRELPEPDVGVDAGAGHRLQEPLRGVDVERQHQLGPRARARQPRRTPSATTSTSPSSSPTATRRRTTSPSQGPGSNNRFRETENGIFSANALKHGPAGAPAPTRVLAFGVGDGATGATNGSQPARDLRHRPPTTAATAASPTTTRPPTTRPSARRCATSRSATARAR